MPTIQHATDRRIDLINGELFFAAKYSLTARAYLLHLSIIQLIDSIFASSLLPENRNKIDIHAPPPPLVNVAYSPPHRHCVTSSFLDIPTFHHVANAPPLPLNKSNSITLHNFILLHFCLHPLQIRIIFTLFI